MTEINSEDESERPRQMTEAAPVVTTTEHTHLLPQGVGWLEVITGSMFSGKTEELIRRLRRALIARQRVLLVKPSIDTRYSVEHVVSHDQGRMPSVSIADPNDLLAMSEGYQVIGIDEAQFFSMDLVRVAQVLADQGRRVIIAGLDQDYRGQPFHPIPDLMARAEYVTKHLAICVQCGNPATCNQRLVKTEGQVLVGSLESYEARCRRCFRPPTEDLL